MRRWYHLALLPELGLEGSADRKERTARTGTLWLLTTLSSFHLLPNTPMHTRTHMQLHLLACDLRGSFHSFEPQFPHLENESLNLCCWVVLRTQRGSTSSKFDRPGGSVVTVSISIPCFLPSSEYGFSLPLEREEGKEKGRERR